MAFLLHFIWRNVRTDLGKKKTHILSRAEAFHLENVSMVVSLHAFQHFRTFVVATTISFRSFYSLFSPFFCRHSKGKINATKTKKNNTFNWMKEQKKNCKRTSRHQNTHVKSNSGVGRLTHAFSFFFFFLVSIVVTCFVSSFHFPLFAIQQSTNAEKALDRIEIAHGVDRRRNGRCLLIIFNERAQTIDQWKNKKKEKKIMRKTIENNL